MIRIFLDPGHGGTNDNVVNGFSESHWNLDFCKKLKIALEATGQFVVGMSRETDIDVSLRERVNKAVRFNADMFLSIHSNAGGGSGSECFYSIHQTNNANMAADLSWCCKQGYNVPDRGAKTRTLPNDSSKDYYAVIRYAVEDGIKAVFLLERAFHDNAYDRTQLTNPNLIDNTIKLMVEQILIYYNLQDQDNIVIDPDDPNIVNEEELESWKAVAIIQDLAVMATTIEGEGEDYNLNRSICNVYVEDYVIEEDGEYKHYTIPSITFPTSMTYAEACQQIINTMGNVSFGCDRYGDICLKNIPRPTQNDEPKFEVTDYIDLTSFTHTEDITDLRNRVIIQSNRGMAMFEHKLLTNAVMKGVNRTTLINVDWADTFEKMKEAAKSAFQQILSHYKKLSIAIKGNPLIEKYDLIKVKDKSTGIDFLYQVREYRHVFNIDSFLTVLELNFVADCDDSAIEFITDEFPRYTKIFKYNLSLANQSKSLKLTFDDAIQRVKIKIKDGSKTLTEIDVVGNTYQGGGINV